MKICPVCDRTYEQGETCAKCGSTLVARVADPLIGRVLKNAFAIEAKIGAGGMGAVYKATQRPLGRPVAVKVLTPVPGQDNLIKRFFREAQLLSQLVHPNIVQVFDFGNTEDGLAYMAMEFMEGQTLDTLVPVGRGLPLPYAQAVMEHLCAGVGAAHARGLVHRDLKPSNCFIARMSDGSQVVKILDFGLARAMAPDSGNARLTMAGTLMGTPGYIAPEQIANPAGADARSDLYAMGAILVFILTGREAYAGDSVQQTLAMQIARPPSLAALRELKLPSALEGLILTLMDPDPERRLQNTDELLMAMRQATGIMLSKLPALAHEKRTGQLTQRTRIMSTEELEQATSGHDESGVTARGAGSPLREALPSDPLLVAEDDEPAPMSPADIARVFGPLGKPGAAGTPEAKGLPSLPVDKSAAPGLSPALFAALDAGPKLKPDPDVKPKPGSASERAPAARPPGEPRDRGPEKSVGLKRAPVVDLGSGGLKTDDDVVAPLATDRLGEGGLASEELNPHSSGEVPLIPDLAGLGLDPSTRGAGPTAPTRLAAPTAGPVASSDAQPVEIDPNKPVESLELMPEVDKRDKPRHRTASSAQAVTRTAAPAPASASVDFAALWADPRHRAGIIAGGALVVLLLGWLVFGRRGAEEVRPADEPARIAAEAAGEVARGTSRAYTKQFGETDLEPTATYEEAKALLNAAGNALAGGKFADAERDYKAAAEKYKAARDEAEKLLVVGEQECTKLQVEVQENLERCERLYRNPELVDRAGLNLGQQSIEAGLALAKKRHFRAATAAFKKAQGGLLDAIGKANAALGDLRQTAISARERTLELRKQFHEIWNGSDLDEPRNVKQAGEALAEGERYINELQFQKAQTALVDAESFFRQATQQVKNQLDSLSNRYAADQRQVLADKEACREYADSGRLEAPPEWDLGQKRFTAAEQLRERRQFKGAFAEMAEARTALDKARKAFVATARNVAAEAHRSAMGYYAKAKAKYDPTDVPPPEALSQAWTLAREAEHCEKDQVYVQSFVKFEQAEKTFRVVEAEADGVILAAQHAAEQAKAEALAQRERATKRIRGREPLPAAPDALVAKADQQLSARKLIGSKKIYGDATAGFVKALEDFEARLAAKKVAALALRAKAQKAAGEASALGDDVEAAKVAEAASVVAQADGLFPDEKYDDAGLLFAGAERTYRQALSVAYIRRGGRQFEAGAYAAALAEYEQAIVQDGSNPKGYYNRGITRYQLNDAVAAIGDFDTAISLDGNHADSYYSRGLAYDRQRNQVQALADFDKAIQLAPDDWRPYYRRGSIYASLNRPSEALSSLRPALEKAPESQKPVIQTLINRLQGK